MHIQPGRKQQTQPHKQGEKPLFIQNGKNLFTGIIICCNKTFIVKYSQIKFHAQLHQRIAHTTHVQGNSYKI